MRTKTCLTCAGIFVSIRDSATFFYLLESVDWASEDQRSQSSLLHPHEAPSRLSLCCIFGVGRKTRTLQECSFFVGTKLNVSLFDVGMVV